MSCGSRSPQSPVSLRRRPALTAGRGMGRAALVVMTSRPRGNFVIVVSMVSMAASCSVVAEIGQGLAQGEDLAVEDIVGRVVIEEGVEVGVEAGKRGGVDP